MRKQITKTLALILALIVIFACAGELVKTGLSLDSSDSRWVRKTLARMSLEQKIGQMIGLRYTSRFMNRDSEVLEDLNRWVAGHHIGGFIQVRGGVYETAVLTNALQRMADVPLLIASDLERGAGNQIEGATLFPPAMSIGATGSEELAHAMGRITAVEARAVGIHMTYAPVVALFSRLTAAKGSVGLKERHIRLIKELARLPEPVVVISFNSPYFLRQFPEVDAYLCAYRHAEQSQTAVARALFGRIGLKGRLPVSIPGLFPAGHGIRLKAARLEE